MADDDFEPYSSRVVPSPVSNFGTLLHFLKCTIGTGILAMPKAFEYTGLVFGTVATFVTGILCAYAINMLIKTEYLLCRRRKVAYMDYSEAMVYAVENGPICLRCLAKTLGILANLFNISLQVGICCVYVIFVSKNVKAVVDDFHCDVLALRVYMCIFLGLFLLMNCVPNLKLFAPLSGLANLLMLTGLFIILYHVYLHFPSSLENRSLAGDPVKWVMFVGICFFAMVTVGVVLSAESTMKNPQSFGGVWALSMSIVTTLYWLIGFVGYASYGSEIKGSITLNLPQKILLSQITQIIFASCIFISYGLQCFPAVEIIWLCYVLPHMPNSSTKMQWVVQYIIRGCLVIFTFALAMAFAEYLANAISFVGVLCVSMLAFTFPPLMHICYIWPENNYGKFKWILIKDILFILLGFFLLIAGTVTSIIDVVTAEKEESSCHTPTNSTNSTSTSRIAMDFS